MTFSRDTYSISKYQKDIEKKKKTIITKTHSIIFFSYLAMLIITKKQSSVVSNLILNDHFPIAAIVCYIAVTKV